MTRVGIDLAWARPTVAQIKSIGATWVARYFSNDDNKDLHRDEVTAYPAAGIDIVVVWESTTGRARAGRAAGVADAQNADAQRRAAGLPGDMPLHFAVDEDTTWSAVQAYFDGVISVIGLSRTGCYGGLDVINGAYGHGLRYLWQTVAWSHGQWSPHATIRQTGGTVLGGAADWDTAMADDFGQYPRPTPPQEIDMTPEQAKQLADLHALLVPFAGWGYRNADQVKKDPKTPDAYGYLVTAATQITALNATVAALTKAVGNLHPGVDTATLVTAVQQAIADAVVHVQVDVTSPTA